MVVRYTSRYERKQSTTLKTLKSLRHDIGRLKLNEKELKIMVFRKIVSKKLVHIWGNSPLTIS